MTKKSKELRRAIEGDIREGVDEMAEGSHKLAPVETGALKASILASVDKRGWAEYVYGSHLPYAQRQNYEHETRGYYFHRAIWAETPELYAKLKITVARVMGT